MSEQQAYGRNGLQYFDRLGVYLSRQPVVNVVQRYQKPHLLDIGCGFHAKLLCELQPRLAQGVGVDLQVSDQVKSIPNLAFHEATIEQSLQNLSGQQFDIILMISVLEHLWNPQAVLSACHALLRPHGAIVINVPNWTDKLFLELVAFRLKLSPEAEGVDDHKMYYNKQDLWPLLVRAGFKPSHIHMRYHKFGLNLFTVAVKS